LAPVAQGRALVQLGALASEEAARNEWERLTRRVPELAAFHPRITKLEREGQATLYRLRTGGLAAAAAARSLCEAVRAKGGACAAFGG
jgi:cell division septation protein DedD